MGIDLVGQFISQYNAYGNLRGTRRGTGKPLSTSRHYPKTTWADVMVASVHFAKYADPDKDDCISLLMKHKGVNKTEALKICAFGDRHINPLKFKRTSGYKQAKLRYYATVPAKFVGFFDFFNTSKMQEEYPHNEKFWHAAHALIIERSAAGVVPFWDEVAMDSVREAIRELPSTVGTALKAVDPRKLIPDVSPLISIMKWGTVAGGLFLLWKAMAPKEGK